MGQPGSAGSAPSSQELTQLAQTIVRRVGHYLSGKGCWSWMPNNYLTLDCVDEAPLNQLRPYRIAGGAAGRAQGVHAADVAGLRLWSRAPG